MIDEYIKALKAGEKEYKAKLSAGEYPYLPALDDVCPDNDTMPQRSMGLIELPVDLIAGTKTRARQNSFAPDFMPLLDIDTEFASKWMRASTALSRLMSICTNSMCRRATSVCLSAGSLRCRLLWRKSSG